MHFPHFEPVEQLQAIRELVWRKELLLEPITLDLEAAAHKYYMRSIARSMKSEAFM